MTDDYIALVNGDDARRYIKSVSAEGNTLGLLATQSLEVVGDVYAFAPLKSKNETLPPLMERDLRQSFSSRTESGLREGANPQAALASEIGRHLSSGPSKIVILADPIAQTADKWLESLVAHGIRVAVCASEVYYLLFPEDVGRGRILDTLSWGPETEICLFSEFATSDRTTPINLSPEDLGAIVERTESIVVGAFDGESFLCFRVAGRGR